MASPQSCATEGLVGGQDRKEALRRLMSFLLKFEDAHFWILLLCDKGLVGFLLLFLFSPLKGTILSKELSNLTLEVPVVGTNKLMCLCIIQFYLS